MHGKSLWIKVSAKCINVNVKTLQSKQQLRTVTYKSEQALKHLRALLCQQAMNNSNETPVWSFNYADKLPAIMWHP